MSDSVLIAGIGNIFQGDDAFGVEVVHQLANMAMPKGVRVLDIGIRGIDLAFALLDSYDLVILVDATLRGGAPGTLYTIDIDPSNIPWHCDESATVNSHGLDPVSVLAFARSMGAQLSRVLLVGCEPLVVEHEETGHIGLSDVVKAAVVPAVETIRQLVEEFLESEASAPKLKEDEVCSHERS